MLAPRAGSSGSWTPHNKRMHATRDTLRVIERNLAGGRVMRSVKSPECAAARLRAFRGGAPGRFNYPMHPTADTRLVIYLLRLGAAGDCGVRPLVAEHEI